MTQTLLPNGLRVVVIENHALPAAEVAMWYRFGSADDPPDRPGVAHALEHMMFRGTRALSGTALDLISARFGLESNAETTVEYTHYFETAPSASVPLALHIEADRMRGLRLDPRDWNLERQAVLTELADSDWSDTGALEDEVTSAAYRGTPYAHDPGGTSRSVGRITVTDLRRAYDRGYQPANATLVVTGDVQPAAIVRLAATLFGPIRGRAPMVHPASETIARRDFVIRRRALSDDVIDVALEAQRADGPDRYAEELAKELIQPTHAVLEQALVVRGPCTFYEVDDDSQLHGGLVHILCHLDEGESATRALHEVERALRLLPSRVTAADIAYARRADIASTTYACDSLTEEADLFGEIIALEGVDPRQFDAGTARISDAAVIAVLRRWSTPVGVAIATDAPKIRIDKRARRPRTERVAPAPLEPEIEPAWARAVPPAFALPSSAPAEAFALANGLRVFVQARPGNGTVYLRGGLDRSADLADWNPALDREADQHAVVFDDYRSSTHGFARELPLMLSMLATYWRVHERAGRSANGLDAPQPRDAWIAVTGDVTSDTVLGDVDRTFGPWRNRTPADVPSPSPSPSPQPAHPSGLLAIVEPGAIVRDIFILAAPHRASPDFAATMVLNAILGLNSDADTRLMREVRARRGLVYSVGSEYVPNDGALSILFESTGPHLAAARTAVRDVVKGLRTGPISAEERSRAYRKLVALALLNQASPDGVLDNLNAAALEHIAPDDVASLAGLYAAVSADDLRRVAARELQLEHALELEEGRMP